MSCPRLVAILSATLALGCNLVVSLDDLQDGAGGASSSSQSTATSASATLSVTATATSASTTRAATGGGGEGPGYDDCVEALGPVVRLRLDGAGGDSEMNLGAWGGSAVYEGGRNAEAPLVAGSLAAASFAPDGKLVLPAQSGFFGGSQAFTIELWFSAPMDYAEDVVALLSPTEGFVLRLEERLDAQGLDAVRFRFFAESGMTDRVVIENLDLSGGVHHIVAVYQEAPFSAGDAEDLQIFVDGAAPTNLASGTEVPMPPLEGSLTFGNDFAGPIDELSIYPVALDPVAIAALHALGSGKSATCPAP